MDSLNKNQYQLAKSIPLFDEAAIQAIYDLRRSDLDKAIQIQQIQQSMSIGCTSNLFYNQVEGKNNHGTLTTLVDITTMTQRMDKMYWNKLIAEFGVSDVMARTEIEKALDEIRFFKFPEFTVENIKAFANKTFSDRYVEEAMELHHAFSNIAPEKMLEHKDTLKPVVEINTIYSNLDVIRKVLRHKQNEAVLFADTKTLMQNYNLVQGEWLTLDFDNMQIRMNENKEVDIRFSTKAMADLKEIMQCVRDNHLVTHLSKLEPYVAEYKDFNRTFYSSEFKTLIKLCNQIPYWESADKPLVFDKEVGVDSFGTLWTLNTWITQDNSAVGLSRKVEECFVSKDNLIPLFKCIAIGGRSRDEKV